MKPATVVAHAFLIALTCLPAAGAQAQDRADIRGHIEVAFGPEGGAEGLILQTIAAARTSIRLAAFAFSSPAIVEALVAARKRGIDVRIVVDRKHNVDEDERGIGRAALGALTKAGASVRINGNYRIHHDKFMVVDERTVQTGSYNYAASANRNSENVIVVRDDPAVAQQYLAHWQTRFDAGTRYVTH